MSPEPAYRLPPRYYRLFGVSLSGFAAVSALTGVVYADWWQAGGGAVALALSAPFYGWVGRRRSEAAAQAWLHGLNLACLAVVALTHPPGTGVGPMYMAFCMGSTVFSARARTGVLLVIAGAAATWALPSVRPVVSAIPPAAGILPPFLLLGGGSWWLVGRSRARTTRRYEGLVEAAAVLGRDAADLLGRRAELEAVGAELAERNAGLQVRLARSRRTTAELAARRADEHALVTAVHHDLREPLRSIVSFSQLLARRLNGRTDVGRAGEFLALAIDGGRRMTGMLDDLLAYAEPGAEAGAAVPCDLSEVAAATAADLADLLTRTSATVTCAGLGVVRGHRALLSQLLLNLVGNALKFARPGVPPRVDISGALTPDGRYRLGVRDNGVGIAPERLGVIFDLFRRVEAEAHREGSGIGLALCRRIALRHGADLTVVSTPGEGSEFRVTFPPGAYLGPGAATPAPAPPSSSDATTAATPAHRRDHRHGA